MSFLNRVVTLTLMMSGVIRLGPLEEKTATLGAGVVFITVKALLILAVGYLYAFSWKKFSTFLVLLLRTIRIKFTRHEKYKVIHVCDLPC